MLNPSSWQSTRCTFQRCFEAWAGVVDPVLDNSGVGHGQRAHYESPCYSCDGLELDFGFAQGWVDDAIEYWNENNDCYWIDILHDIVL